MATIPLPLTVPDVVCMLDVDAFGRETTTDLQSLSQDVFHRLLEVPGSNPDDETLGIGVEEMLSGGVAQLAMIERKVDEQLALDPRVDACIATLTKDATGKYTLAIKLTVNGAVTGLRYTYTADGGLVPA